MSLLVRRCLARFWAALIAYGHLWVHIPDTPLAPGHAPAPGHPERLCPWLPATEQEQAIWDDLTPRSR
ncbi:DUF6059 family protein [Streptomyces sp. NPDC059816]|uniref:DUF6059 family protein n=1 Tax=Streptomyces sp. NPDC059816 TaxID=3346960 RepID=UPI00365A0F25